MSLLASLADQACVYKCLCCSIIHVDEDLEDKKPLIVSGLKIILNEQSLRVGVCILVTSSVTSFQFFLCPRYDVCSTK